MLDFTALEALEIQISANGKTVWIHVLPKYPTHLTEVTVLRACRIKKLILHDDRLGKKEENVSDRPSKKV